MISIAVPHRYDVIVVGARAAGASTAMLLARAGLRVLVIDRSRYGADTLSTHGLMRAGVLQLHRWGLLDRIVSAGTPAVRTTTFTLADDQIVIPVKPAHGVDALYAPRRTVLDPMLVDAAMDAGADVRFGVTMTGLLRADDGTVSGILGHDDTGRPFVASAGLVIGADGRRSTVAGLVHAPIERAGTASAAVVYGYWSGLEPNGYEWMFANSATAGVIPTNGGESCVFVCARPGRFDMRAVATISDVITSISPEIGRRLAAATSPPRARSFPGRPGTIRRSWGPGWALVGDAGYWKDPISAHGLSDALRDAELLARAVIESVGPAERLEALGDYQATRDRLSADLFEVTERVAELTWSDAEIGQVLVDLSAAMADEVALLAGLDDRRDHDTEAVA